MTSNIKELRPPPAKSKKLFVDFLLRMVQRARKRKVISLAVILVYDDGSFYVEHKGLTNAQSRDDMLEAVEQLHEDVYIDTL